MSRTFVFHHTVLLCNEHFKQIEESLSYEGSPATISEVEDRYFDTVTDCSVDGCESLFDKDVTFEVSIPIDEESDSK